MQLDRNGVVIGVVVPVVAQTLKVGVPQRRFGFTTRKRLEGALGYGDGGHSRRGAEALLRPGVRVVNAPLEHVKGHHAHRRHRVHRDQRTFSPGQGGNLGSRIEHPGRGFAVNHRQHLGFAAHGALYVLKQYCTAHRSLDQRHFGPITLGHVGHAVAERPVGTHHHLVARLEQVGEARVHAQAAGSSQQRGKSSLSCAVKRAEVVLHSSVEREHSRVHVTEHRLLQGGLSVRLDGSRARSEEQHGSGHGGHLLLGI